MANRSSSKLFTPPNSQTMCGYDYNNLGVFLVSETGLILTDLFEPHTVEELKKEPRLHLLFLNNLRVIKVEKKGGER